MLLKEKRRSSGLKYLLMGYFIWVAFFLNTFDISYIIYLPFIKRMTRFEFEDVNTIIQLVLLLAMITNHEDK